MTNRIVTGDKLKQFAQKIRLAIDPASEGLAVDLDDSAYGESFQYYWAFSHPESLSDVGYGAIDEQTAFYNTYYWFLTFTSLYISKHGPNAGLEQQVFQLLEHADLDLDWALIEHIDKLVESESGVSFE